MRDKYALFLNNTADSYHWGCFGTCMAIYDRLISDGFFVHCVDVETIQKGLGTPPENVEQLESFGSRLKEANPAVWRAVRNADLVVANGEGTIHRFHGSPRGYLGLLWYAKSLGKTVHLINHSCFPSGSLKAADENVENYYRECLRDVNRIVPREIHSLGTYERLGLSAEQGFDSLPLVIDRNHVTRQISGIVIGGASFWNQDHIAKIGPVLAEAFARESAAVFLSGGRKFSPPEDSSHYDLLRSFLPGIRLVEPQSLAEWLGWIGSAKMVVTGRFHHLVACVALRSPFVIMPGNTPKSDGICKMLGFRRPVSPTEPTMLERLHHAISKPQRTTEEQVAMVSELAERNFAFG